MHRCVNYALPAVGVKSITYSDDHHLTIEETEMYTQTQSIYLIYVLKGGANSIDSNKTTKMRKNHLLNH